MSTDEKSSFNRAIDERFLREALAEARRAAHDGEVPVGAVLVRNGEIVARGHNRKESRRDPTAHAEIEAIREAVDFFPSWRRDETTLYVTLEPCPMCAGAILQARIERVVYGCADPKAGGVETLFRLLDDPRLNHRCEITSGVLADECAELLTTFFRTQRLQGKNYCSHQKNWTAIRVELPVTPGLP